MLMDHGMQWEIIDAHFFNYPRHIACCIDEYEDIVTMETMISQEIRDPAKLNFHFFQRFFALYSIFDTRLPFEPN